MKKVIFFITLLVIVLAVSIYPPQESKASVNLRLIKNSTSKNIYTDSLKIKSDSVQILVKELLHQDTILENINSELKK